MVKAKGEDRPSRLTVNGGNSVDQRGTANPKQSRQHVPDDQKENRYADANISTLSIKVTVPKQRQNEPPEELLNRLIKG